MDLYVQENSNRVYSATETKLWNSKYPLITLFPKALPPAKEPAFVSDHGCLFHRENSRDQVSVFVEG